MDVIRERHIDRVVEIFSELDLRIVDDLPDRFEVLLGSLLHHLREAQRQLQDMLGEDALDARFIDLVSPMLLESDATAQHDHIIAVPADSDCDVVVQHLRDRHASSSRMFPRTDTMHCDRRDTKNAGNTESSLPKLPVLPALPVTICVKHLSRSADDLLPFADGLFLHAITDRGPLPG